MILDEDAYLKIAVRKVSIRKLGEILFYNVFKIFNHLHDSSQVYCGLCLDESKANFRRG